MEGRLRRADSADVDAIEQVVHDSFSKYVPRIGKPPAPMLVDFGEAVATARVWVVEQADQRIVAVLVTEDHRDHLLLDIVAVAPGAQGHGHGTLLLDRAERDARELGLPEIRLVTNQAMTENLSFYPRHGYTETGRGHQDGYDRVFYRKSV